MHVFRSILLTVAIVVMALGSGPGYAEGVALYSARYNVYADGLKVGEMERTARDLGEGNFAIETLLYTTGLVSIFKSDRYYEYSVWRETEAQAVPQSFFSRYSGSKEEVVERLTFDWPSNRVISLRDGRETQVNLEPGVLDKLMYQEILRRDLAKGIKRFSYRVADRGVISDYELEVVGEETLSTKVGQLKTVRVAKGTTTLWCAPSLDYLPVKLEQEENGHTLSSQLQSVTKR